MSDLIYDIEVYNNIFTCVIYSVEHEKFLTYEVSSRRNDFDDMCETLIDFGRDDYRLVGFNNQGYDYPVLHAMLKLWQKNRKASATEVNRVAKQKSNQIIDTPFDDRFDNIIWDNDQFVPQVDLLKINHFDNRARATSLKAIEFNNRSENIGDLPHDPNENVPVEGFDELIEYNKHDVVETHRFYEACEGAFELRETLGAKYGRSFTNHNDTKIGKDIFIMALEKCDIPCYEKVDGKKKLRQTKRASIDISEIIFDYIKFETREFNAMLKWFNGQTIRETKGVFTEVPFDQCKEFLWYADKRPKKGKLKEVNVVIGGEYRDTSLLPGRAWKSSLTGGLKYVFGTGGLHASLHDRAFFEDDDYCIVDVDVTSYYPWLSIANNVYPEHLGSEL